MKPTTSPSPKHGAGRWHLRRLFCLGVLLCFVSIALFAQNITIRKNAAPLDDVLLEIRKQTGYQFFYDNEVKQILKSITINLENVTLEVFLKKCFESYPINYSVVNKAILLKKASPRASDIIGQDFSKNDQHEIKGKVIDILGKPLTMATIRILQTDITSVSKEDGTFSLPFPDKLNEITISVSYVGKTSVTKIIKANQLSSFQLITLEDLSLKLKEVEVNGVRKRTAVSNSSVVFDREAIEQTQALSVGDVLRYMPGQSIIRPGAALQGASVITLRGAVPPNSEQSMNNAFGINMQIDGNSVNNNANMQTFNPARSGMLSANLSTPNTLGDLSQKNGTFNSDYIGDVANNGVDLRQIQAENIESIEVVSGVASARYGDYSTGVILINRQAGITPLRLNVRTNEGTQNAGVNKGFKLGSALGVMNLSLDYLSSNDDPRNKLKSFERVGGGMIWTSFIKKKNQFKNTLSADFNTTIDKTRVDPDDGNDRKTNFDSKNLRLSNRSELIVKKPWLYSVQLQLSYNRGRQESYSQYYLNTRPIMGIADGEETKTYESYFAPGYYLAIQHIIGEPVTASGRLETTSFFKTKKISYKLTLGTNYEYSANKGPGTLIFSDKPRFYQSGNKNDRARNYNYVPTQQNIGFYAENLFSTRLLGKYFTTNIGVRGDVQNRFFTLAPRWNATWKLHKKLAWNVSYGIATKAPSLSQVSPGNVYIDIPLVNVYTGDADKSVYLVHTKVVPVDNSNLRPYKSTTFETGFSWDAKPFHLSAFYFFRKLGNGFNTVQELEAITLPNYDVTLVPGGKPTYEPSGTFKTYNVVYSRMRNANTNTTDGLELMFSVDKIKAISTSFNLNTSVYRSSYSKKERQIYIPDESVAPIDYSKQAVYGAFENQQSKAVNIKSTITTTTHISPLRMILMFTGEIFWVNRTQNFATSMYPSGYYNKELQYFPLKPSEALFEQYAHLRKTASEDAIRNNPSFVYPNIHMRLSKEIGDFLRFSFTAFNAFNIRPIDKVNSTNYYYNGRPAFGAELVFTIK